MSGAQGGQDTPSSGRVGGEAARLSSHAGQRHHGLARSAAWPAPVPNYNGVPACSRLRRRITPPARWASSVCQRRREPCPGRGRRQAPTKWRRRRDATIETSALCGQSAASSGVRAPERLAGLAFRRRREQGAPPRAALGAQHAVSIVPGPPSRSRGWRKPPRRRRAEKGAGGRGDCSGPGEATAGLSWSRGAGRAHAPPDRGLVLEWRPRP